MWRWRPDVSGRWRALPRTKRCEGRGVFALVVRCGVMRLLLYSRVGKNPRHVGAGCDTRRESPAVPGRQPQNSPLSLPHCRTTVRQ